MESHRIFTLALSALLAVPATAQDRNNEDEVVKVDARLSAYECREGEVIVKFKDQSTVQIKAPRRTKFKSCGSSSVDAALRELGVTEIEELMPLTGNQQVKRLARDFNGKTVAAATMNRIYLMRYDKTKVRNAEEAAAKLAELSEVEYAEPNRLVYALGTADSQSLIAEATDAQDEQGGVKMTLITTTLYTVSSGDCAA